jgi:uncharacterized membrane protein YeaQ/YmgE (transglycosylase-associated protein family)
MGAFCAVFQSLYYRSDRQYLLIYFSFPHLCRLQDLSRMQNALRHGENTMSVISWIILGLIAGFIGSKIVNKSGQGMLMDIVLGIVGAVIGGVIFNFFGAAGVTGLNIYSLIVSVIGAVVVLFLYHAVSGQKQLR